MSDEEATKDKEAPRPSLRGFARRILRDGEEDERRLDPREIMGAVLDTGDKAKTEIVRMLAREVRAYFEALELSKDARHALTNYSLDVRMNISLKPLADMIPNNGGPVSVRVGGTKATKAKASEE
jgi:hypothetical protein